MTELSGWLRHCILIPKRVKITQVNNCNCRKPIECPFPNNYLTESVIYQATANTADKRLSETFIGLKLMLHGTIFTYDFLRNNCCAESCLV